MVTTPHRPIRDTPGYTLAIEFAGTGGVSRPDPVKLIRTEGATS
ncbi:MAG TPA: hypothetical protein VIJ85_05365 [Rhizomicrobium sp.]